MKTIKDFAKRNILWILALGLALLKAMYPVFNRPMPPVYEFVTIVDQWIPFMPVWIIPYVLWYLFLPGVLLLLAIRDKKACTRALLTQIMGIITCYIMYSIFQTTVPRPDVPGTDVFSVLVRGIYSIDEPYNAFPSIHVLGASALMLATYGAKNIGKWVNLGVQILGTLIILATVFVKQHVVLDMLAGLILAGGYYLASARAAKSLAASAESRQPG